MKANAAAAEKQSLSRKNKIINIVVNVILVLAILFGVFCAYTAFEAKNDGVPTILGMRFFSIQSDSMSPTFNEGDLIVDTKVRKIEKLEVGDVITFWTVINGERTKNTHRIVKIDDYGTYLSFTTRGDNPEITNNDRLTVHQNEVVGKYAFRLPGLGTFIDFLQTPKGFLLAIVLPVAIFFVWQLIQFFRSLFAYQGEKMRLQIEARYAAERTANASPAAEKKPDENDSDASGPSDTAR